ncbi:MBL fold metallo-hydrolase [Xylanimonas ulmi]|uniref:L-ascorbate metabolism protein UlaG (Beta-lactamase superfamily) n=1 Tax=Xylanimonas ulmi TaxID=228973 RepID=A0A4Q7M283_9MICO|nr:MBL fold metallo-hydrolase [Xylanibacterium ulmi]RZS60702.1 L-ascorbate metabolism protein UlaG (beta-lactamase superfamily) [Xylanibacterium ulmi]
MNELTPLDGPTVLIDFCDLRFVVDPTFDNAQEYPVGARSLRKTTDSTWRVDQVGPLDAVLLSHDQHVDNLDHGGRELLAQAPLTLTTPLAASRLAGTARGLDPWEALTLGAVTVTAVPAQHGPDGTEHLTGPVTGFVLQARQAPTIYISGDNASLAVVEEIGARFPSIDVAVLFAGAAHTPLVDGSLTLTSTQAAQAIIRLGRPRTLAMHTDGWAHFTENGATLRAAFATAGLGDLLLPTQPGDSVAI